MRTEHAFVTGASEGIGRAFAMRLAAEGYAVTAVARNEARLTSLLEALPGEGHRLCVADLGSSRGIAAAAAMLGERHYALLVNNAGLTYYGCFHEVAWGQQQEILRVSCEALGRLAHGFLRQAGAGDALVNVSSMLAFLPQPTSAMYSASKAFVTALSEALWFENKGRGVYVFGLHPGVTRTEFRRRGGGGATRAPWAQEAEHVVEVGMRALRERRHSTVVSGDFNRALAWLSRAVPRQALVSLLGRARSRRRREEAR